MAVQQRSYTDPTAQIFQMLQGLGGSKTTTSGNPTGVQGLEQILQQQLGMTTPEGMAKLIASIFEQGGKAVPQIATQYGQAAGARVSNNSQVKLANAELQKQIASKAVEAIMGAQRNAAETAGALAKAGSTVTQKSQFSPMQLAPFIPGLLGKLKDSKLMDGIFGEEPMNSFGFNDASISFGGFGGADVGDSFGSMVDIGDFGSGSFGFNDFGLSAGDALGSVGGDIIGEIADSGILDTADGWLGFADGGKVDVKKLTSKPKGYADGGAVTAGPVFDATSPSGNLVRGITYNGSNSVIPILSAINSGVGGAGASRDLPANMRKNFGEERGAGDAVSVPSVVGTPDENAAAIAGMVGMAIGAMTGIPAAVSGLAMTQMGIPNSSMSPVGKSVNFLQALISQALGLNADDSESPQGGMSTVGPTGAGMSTVPGMDVSPVAAAIGFSAPNTGFDAMAAIGGSSSPGGTAVGGVDAGIGGTSGSGVSADGSAASGVDGDSGVGSTSAFKKGGQVEGPGTATSDSILARLSDGEFVVNAEATEQFLPILEMLNAFGLKQRGANNAAR